ncbi:MAG TPA: MFS transporter [Gemmatimonadales bacterium]|nr:MFS transporter [Gemmatimonadales bacterium]
MSRLPRPVKLFGFVSLLNDFASEMIYPLLPAFVTGVLGGGAVSLGALDGAADFAAAVVKYRAGRLSDKPSRRGPLIIFGYLVAVLVRPVIAFTGAAWQVIGLRVTDRIGKGIRTPPRDALIADVTPAELHGRAFGLQRGLDHAGAILGPLVAWWLLSSNALDVRGVIAASIIPGVLVLVLAIWAVGDGRRRQETAGATAPQQPLPSPTVPSRPLPPALLAIFAFYLLRMPETLILLRTQEIGVSVASVPLLWAALHVVRSSTSFVGGALSDRIGPSRTMWLGWICYAAIAMGFALAERPLEAWVLVLAFGLVAGLTESPERALVSRLAGGKQGTGFGTYHGATGVAALIGGILLGTLFQSHSAGLSFLVSASAATALIVVWPLVSRSTLQAE